jgi:hypothetical protein
MTEPLDLTPAEHRLFLNLRRERSFASGINTAAAARRLGISRQAGHALMNAALKRNRVTTKAGIFRRWARAGSFDQYVDRRGRAYDTGGVMTRQSTTNLERRV